VISLRAQHLDHHAALESQAFSLGAQAFNDLVN
jgi:hypothetical protein